MAAAGAATRWDLRHRRLYLCTPDRPDLEEFVEACIRGGVDVVQLREKHLDDDALAARGALAQAVCRRHQVPFVFNDRPDLAAAIGADGVHVGQDDAPPEEARQLVGEEAIVGLSTHSVADLDRAGRLVRLDDRSPHPAEARPVAPVDYLSAGPVTPTPTKPGRPGTGLGYVTEAVEWSPWPVWVTGGVAPDTVGPMVGAGARHFVVVRWLAEADAPETAARQLRMAIDEALRDAAESGASSRGGHP